MQQGLSDRSHMNPRCYRGRHWSSIDWANIGMAIALILSLTIGFVGIGAGLSPTAWADTERSTAPEDATVYILAPADGELVPSTFTVKFGLVGMGIAPAGIDVKNTGHHHLLIDTQDLPDLSQPLSASDTLKHFGAGQTETELTLESGTHTLQLVLGNYAHIPHNEPVISDLITITVE